MPYRFDLKLTVIAVIIFLFVITLICIMRENVPCSTQLSRCQEECRFDDSCRIDCVDEYITCSEKENQ